MASITWSGTIAKATSNLFAPRYATALPTEWIVPYGDSDSQVAYIARLTDSLGYLQILTSGSTLNLRIDSSATGDGAFAGPELTPAMESDMTITFAHSTAGSVTVPGPDASSGVNSRDSTEPYQWVLDDGAVKTAMLAWFSAVSNGDTITVTIDDNAAPTLPDADAPTVTISALDDIDEGGEHTFTISLSGGTYDTIAVTASIGGTAQTVSGSGDTRTVAYTAPQVASDTDYTLTVNVSVTGTGTNAANGTSDTASDTETWTVNNVPAATRTLPVVMDFIMRIGQAFTHTFPEMQNPDGTVAYDILATLSPVTQADLPGLSFDTSTRTLAGTPTAELAETRFWYRAVDNQGALSRAFNITILPQFSLDENPSHFGVDETTMARHFRLSWRPPMDAQRYSVTLRTRDLITGALTRPAWLPADLAYADAHSAAFVDTQAAPDELSFVEMCVIAYESSEAEKSRTVYAGVVIPPANWNPTHRLLCDWDRDGSPTDEFEHALRVIADIGRQNDLLNSPINPSLSVTFSNESERYTDDDPDSPLMGKVVPGFDVCFEIVNGSQTIPLFVGTASEIGADGESLLARLSADGQLTVLADVMLGETNNASAFTMGDSLFTALGIPAADVHEFGTAETVVRYAASGSAQQILRSLIPILHKEDAHGQLHGGVSVTPSGKIRMDAGHWADGQSIDTIRAGTRPALGSNIRSMANRIGARLVSITLGTAQQAATGWATVPNAQRPQARTMSDGRRLITQYNIQSLPDAQFGYIIAGNGVDDTNNPDFIRNRGGVRLATTGGNPNALSTVVTIGGSTTSGGHARPQTTVYYLPQPLPARDFTTGAASYEALEAYGDDRGLGTIAIQIQPFPDDPPSGQRTFSLSNIRVQFAPYTPTTVESTVRDAASDERYGTRRAGLGVIPLLDGDTGDVLTGRILSHRKAPRRHVTQRYQVVDPQTSILLAYQSGDVVTHKDRRYRVLRKVYTASQGAVPEVDLTIIEATPIGV